MQPYQYWWYENAPLKSFHSHGQSFWSSSWAEDIFSLEKNQKYRQRLLTQQTRAAVHRIQHETFQRVILVP